MKTIRNIFLVALVSLHTTYGTAAMRYSFAPTINTAREQLNAILQQAISLYCTNQNNAAKQLFEHITNPHNYAKTIVPHVYQTAMTYLQEIYRLEEKMKEEQRRKEEAQHHQAGSFFCFNPYVEEGAPISGFFYNTASSSTSQPVTPQQPSQNSPMIIDLQKEKVVSAFLQSMIDQKTSDNNNHSKTN